MRVMIKNRSNFFFLEEEKPMKETKRDYCLGYLNINIPNGARVSAMSSEVNQSNCKKTDVVFGWLT